MSNAEFRCECCDSNEQQLNVHHSYYVPRRDPWDYPDWALKCLCKDCHKDLHENEISDDEVIGRHAFEEMFEWLEGKTDAICITWDLCAQFAMLRETNPELVSDFAKIVIRFAEQTRLKLQNQNQNNA